MPTEPEVTIKLVLADDQPIVLDGLTQLFRAEPDMKVLARCETQTKALQAVRTHTPDVVILGGSDHTMDGLMMLREIRNTKLPTRVVLFTAAIDGDQALEAVRLGVRGVVLKGMAPRYLVQCVRKVHAGEQWLEKRSIGRVLDKLLQREAGAREIAEVLTPREIEIVQMTARGLRNKEIASGLAVSEGTVKTHLHNIYDKLRLDGRVALTLYVRQKGLV